MSIRIHLKGRFCVYCGDSGTTTDHFPPKSYSSFGYLLPACLECNIIASDCWPDNFYLRTEFVKNQLRYKYRSYLATPEWNIHELNLLGRGLKSEVESWQINIVVLKKRLMWNPKKYLTIIDHTEKFPAIFIIEDFLDTIALEHQTNSTYEAIPFSAPVRKTPMRACLGCRYMWRPRKNQINRDLCSSCVNAARINTNRIIRHNSKAEKSNA